MPLYLPVVLLVGGRGAVVLVLVKPEAATKVESLRPQPEGRPGPQRPHLQPQPPTNIPALKGAVVVGGGGVDERLFSLLGAGRREEEEGCQE